MAETPVAAIDIGTNSVHLLVARPVGTIWLRALQMTIVPLVAALLRRGPENSSRDKDPWPSRLGDDLDNWQMGAEGAGSG